MSHVKAGGTARNTRNSPGQRLGLKRFGGQKVREGEVLMRQVGQTKLAGPGTFMARDFTIHAAHDGIVTFKSIKTKRFTGKTATRTQIMVEVPVKTEAVKKTATKK